MRYRRSLHRTTGAIVLLACAAAACDARDTRRATPSSTSAPSLITPTSTVTVPPSPTVPPAAAPTSTPAPSALPSTPQEIARGNPDRPVIALTFDCGASSVPTPAILDALRAAKVRSTFFLTGQWAAQNPELARAIAAEHEIANHSYSHTDFAQLSDAQIVDEMQRAEAVIQATTGRGTKPFWRAPYGSRDARILALVATAGWYLHIFWTADALDWQDISPEQVRSNVAAKAQNGAIVLQHCGSPQTAAVLADEIRDLSSKGFTFATISELLRQ